MKKLVIISHVFPPSISANAKRPYLMAKYLVNKGWDVSVYTSSMLTRGKPIVNLDGIQVNYVKSPLIEFVERFRDRPKVRKRVEQLLLLGVVPDFFAPWMRKTAGIVKKEAYDYAILNIRPYSGFEFMRAGVLDRRWVVDYQESVYPFLEQNPRTSPLQRLYTSRLFELERQALQACGGVWFTSSANRNRYISDGSVEASKTEYSPYFFDPEMYSTENTRAVETAQMTILYGGHLDGVWRNPEPFFKAWSEFMSKESASAGMIRLIVYGYVSNGVFDMAKRHGLANMIEVRAQIPYRDFLKEAQCSDALLYLDAAGQLYFNPGKLADYFGANRPVLGYTTKGSEVDDMLQICGMVSFTAHTGDDVSGVEALAACWNDWKSKKTSRYSTEFFSVNSVCEKANLFLEKIST